MKHIIRKTLTAGRLAAVLTAITTTVGPGAAHAQWSTTYEQYYLPGKFNFTFRREYPGADRLFNAFDYGHAILYERLYNDSRAPIAELEETEFNFITRRLLVSPPRLPLEEAAIEVNYAKMAPEAKAMFDWAHLLHRQIYDVLASEGLSQTERDAKIAELVAYYKTRPDLAFSDKPKNMDLMEGQPYSLAFRHRYPKFNGLIWGYHWLQVGLYEPLMIGRSQEERQAGVAAAVTRFRQMLEGAPDHLPRVMPMTAAIAPTFARRYPEASIIFDNLHAMHDVVSDILANDDVPHDRKRATILEAASRYRDDSTFLMSVTDWAGMGQMMGIENMGGPAVGILSAWTTPSLPRGVTMAEAMKRMPGPAEMAGMSHGASGAAAPGHVMPGMSLPGAAGSHSGHAMPGMPEGDSSVHAGHASGMGGIATGKNDSTIHRLHDLMLQDPVIHKRVMADTAMRRLLSMGATSIHATDDSPASMSMPPARTTAAKATGKKVFASKTPARKHGTAQTPVETAAPPKPMSHDMPGMKHDMPGTKS